jgi:hypothetical protein
MTLPQPFQYQGSKRALAPLILQYLAVSTTRLVEPFCAPATLLGRDEKAVESLYLSPALAEELEVCSKVPVRKSSSRREEALIDF